MISENPLFFDLASKVAVGIITGSIAAFITAKVTLKRFYHEKWWEKKHIAYNELLDNLFELRDFFKAASRQLNNDRLRRIKYDDEKSGSLDWSRYSELYSILHRKAALSPISLSAQSKIQLDNFFEATSTKNQQVYEEGWPREIAYDELATELDEIIIAIVRDANKELHFK